MHGRTGNTKSADHATQVVKVGLVAAEAALPPLHRPAQVESRFPPNQSGSIEKIPNPTPVLLLEENRPRVYPFALTEAPEGLSHSEPAPNNPTAHDYVLVGQLTRLPAPLTEVDLNIPGINDIEFGGKIELAILIEANGSVSDVTTSLDDKQLRPIFERIAERFKTARFIPGEINGIAVKSQLQITVISERPPRTGN